MVLVPTPIIEQAAFAALTLHGATAQNARPVARSIALAEAEGNAVCGLFYLPHFCAQLAVGKIDGGARPTLTLEGAVVRVDAAMGFAQAAFATGFPLLTQTAKTLGVAAMAIRNSGHALALGHFVRPLAEAGFFSVAMSNAPASVAPPGATARLFGTNPLAWAAPRREGPPILVDQSLSAVTKTEVLMRKAGRKALEPGWAQDARGHPTTNAAMALEGSLLPFGGQKGSNIALMVEVLCTALSGGVLSVSASPLGSVEGGPPRLGQFILALDPTRFDPGFEEALAALEAQVTAAGLRMPGRAHEVAQEVDLAEDLWRNTLTLAGLG